MLESILATAVGSFVGVGTVACLYEAYSEWQARKRLAEFKADQAKLEKSLAQALGVKEENVKFVEFEADFDLDGDDGDGGLH